jgi:16S rRNA (guanine(966)-N(2))-methyltransferase RsmD
VEGRIKKVLHSVLKDEIRGKTVLDLFAGSGSVGIEALSWGAERAVFVDIKKPNLDIVRKNLSSLGLLGSSELYLKDASLACQDFFEKKRRFDFIFMDPPYYKGLLTKTLKTLGAYDIVEPSGFVVSLGFRRESPQNQAFSCVFNRVYGDRLVKIFTPLKP